MMQAASEQRAVRPPSGSGSCDGATCGVASLNRRLFSMTRPESPYFKVARTMPATCSMIMTANPIQKNTIEK